jgi:hypothetical protein
MVKITKFIGDDAVVEVEGETIAKVFDQLDDATCQLELEAEANAAPMFTKDEVREFVEGFLFVVDGPLNAIVIPDGDDIYSLFLDKTTESADCAISDLRDLLKDAMCEFLGVEED